MGEPDRYIVPAELAKILMPIPEAMIRLITLKQLHVQAYWRKPVITGSRAKACPCCGGVHPLAAHGICGGCYEPAIKNGLSGSALLDHLAHRAKFGKKIRATGPKNTIKKSTSPVAGPSFPAALPPVAGPVESKDQSMQLHFIVQAIRISLGLDDKAPVSAIPRHIDKLIGGKKELDDELNIVRLSLGMIPFTSASEIQEQIEMLQRAHSSMLSTYVEAAEILGSGEDYNISKVAALRMAEATEGAKAIAKVAELTEEIATLNRLLATQPMETPAVTEESIVAKWSVPAAEGFGGSIVQACNELCQFLLAKNASYGNSAAEPVRVFSHSDPVEQINVRIDDKLSRMMRGNAYPGDNDELDLVGYLILKRAVIAWQSQQEQAAA